MRTFGKTMKEKCREAHAIDHSIECGYMNLIQSFDEAGMLIQAIIKDTSYLELESRPERSKTLPVEQNKYQQSFCNVDFILDWTDSQKRQVLENYPLRTGLDSGFRASDWTRTFFKSKKVNQKLMSNAVDISLSAIT